MQLQTLGGLALHGTSFKRPKPLLLLGYLAVEGPKDRRHVAELFWPDAADPMSSLRVALNQLRTAAPQALEADGPRILTRLPSDALQLLDALETGDRQRAADLYHGAFLEGFYLAGTGAELEEWIYSTREYLARRVTLTHLQLAEQDAAVGDFQAAARRAETALRLPGAASPEPEDLARLHRLLVAAGSSSARELQQDAADLGLTLELNRDAARAQLSRRGADAPGIANNLPAPTASFVGRDPELVELARLLEDADTRLITLTGPGGIGKSRLALQAAQQETRGAQFRHGVTFVPLESLSEPELIPTLIARELGLDLPGKGDPLSELTEALRDKHLLLVLDNCEHLPQSGPIAARLLKACPALKILATSRDRLDLDGEQLFPVEGLPVPQEALELDDARLQEGVQLFLQRAKRAKLDFSLDDHSLPPVLAICRFVEGSPLGIELAAAWVRSMPPSDIAFELARDPELLSSHAHDVSDRHRSLRATFEYSWRLLSDKEQDVLRKLAVFTGGFSRKAASEVAGASIAQLASLVDKSLLRTKGDGRYDRHPLVHHYSRQKLAENPEQEAAAQAAHAHTFLKLAQDAEARHWGEQQSECLELLEREHDNLRAALEWTLTGGDPEAGLELAASLYYFWYYRSHLVEGEKWLGLALEVAATRAEWDPLRSRLLSAAGVIVNERGDDDRAVALFEERLALARAQGDTTGQAAALNSLGIVALGRHDYARAQTLIEESMTLRRKLGQPKLLSPALNNLGLVALAQGRLNEARAYLEENLTISRQLGDQMGVALAFSNLAAVALESGELDRSEHLLTEALPHFQTLGDQDGLAHCLEGFAALAAAQDRPVTAARLAGAAEALRERIGAALNPADHSNQQRRLAPARAALGETAFAAAWQEGRALTPSEALAGTLGTTTGGRPKDHPG